MMTTLRKRGLTLHKSKEKESKEESHLARALLSFDPFSTTLPPLVTESIKYLEEFGLSEEGLFRVPGFQNQVKEMKETYDRGETVDLATAKNVHTVASLLKYYLAELPEPLLTYELMDCFMLGIDVVVREDDNNHENGIEWSLNPTRSCMKLLPPGNRKLLHTLVTFLAKVADNSAVNCMTASNIATCFAPIIIRRELDPTDLATFIKESKKAERFIECTIQHTDYIFATSETESATHPEMKTEFTQHLERGTMTLASNLLKRENTRQQLVGSESDLSRFMSNNHVARGLPKEVSDSISSPHIVDRKPKKSFRGPLVQDVVASPQVTERSRRVPPSRSVNSPRRDSGLIRSAEASGEKEVKLLAQLLLQGKMDDASKLLKEKSQLGILSYEGETNSQGDPHGHGKLLFQNGDIYVGNFVNGERTGKGKITFRNGNHYEGDFVNGLRHGKGVFVDFKGNRYEGQFFQGKRTGFGRLTFAQEDHSYEGNFEDGVPQGFGKTIFSNGDIYEGDHDADERHGFGIFQGKNGGSYEGWYVRGKREGVGYYISKNGSYYKGTFKNNAIHGFGKFIFVSGDSYIGQFRDGKFHGKGIYQFEAGNSVEGLFKDGQPMEDDVQVDSAWIKEELKKATNLRKPDAEFTLTFDRQRFDEA